MKEAYKYDIAWPHGSKTVTYKEWYYLTPVTDPEQCRLMWFMQGSLCRDRPVSFAKESRAPQQGLSLSLSLGDTSVSLSLSRPESVSADSCFLAGVGKPSTVRTLWPTLMAAPTTKRR